MWRDFGFCGVCESMATYWDYAYCEKCDRPFRTNECRSERTGIGGNRQTNYYCRVCESRARDFDKNVMLPTHLFMALAWCIGWALLYLNEGISVSIMIGLPFPTIEIIPGLVFVGLFVQTKSKCKPIYDRWVMKHGTDHQKWPGASKSE